MKSGIRLWEVNDKLEVPSTCSQTQSESDLWKQGDGQRQMGVESVQIQLPAAQSGRSKPMQV